MNSTDKIRVNDRLVFDVDGDMSLSRIRISEQSRASGKFIKKYRNTKWGAYHNKTVIVLAVWPDESGWSDIIVRFENDLKNVNFETCFVYLKRPKRKSW